MGLGTTNVNIRQEHGRVAEDIGFAFDYLLQLDGGGVEVKIDDNVVAAAADDDAPDHLEQLYGGGAQVDIVLYNNER